MRRDLKILLGTMALGAVTFAWRPVSEEVSSWETFTVRDVEVRGVRYLTDDAVRARLALAEGTSVWVDTEPLRDRLLADPLIRDVVIRRQVPHGLRVEVEERTPIALAPTPTLEPIDADGYRLPLFPEDVRSLVQEVEHLMAADTLFLQRVSSVRRGKGGTLVARWTEPPVEFLLPSTPSPNRLREGVGALSEALARAPGDVPTEVDLTFADQVVVRRTRE